MHETEIKTADITFLLNYVFKFWPVTRLSNIAYYALFSSLYISINSYLEGLRFDILTKSFSYVPGVCVCVRACACVCVRACV